MAETWGGILPAVGSPCNESDEFQDEVFVQLLEHLADKGVHGYYVTGSTGEGFKMRLDERKRAASAAVEVGNRRQQKVIVHVGANATRDAVELGRHAAQAGADAIASMPVRGDFAVNYAYYSELASVGLPLFVYHVPAMVGISFSLDEIFRLLDVPNIIGLKYTAFDLIRVREICAARPGTPIFNGPDDMLCTGLAYGACGGIGSFYNVFPELLVALYDATQADDYTRAYRFQVLFLDYLSVCIAHTTPPSLEYCMRLKGFGPYWRRKPRPELSKESQAALQKQYEATSEALDRILAG